MGIELERAISSILVGRRHRIDMGDIDALVASIAEHGLLQPITITPDGKLVCGARRLAAIRRLGWKTVNVWVRSGISDRLDHLLSEQDDNVLHKPLTQIEAAALYREIKQVMAEDAARRDAATRFSSDYQPRWNGEGNFPAPIDTARGRADEQAAAMIPGAASYKTLNKIGFLEQVANDPEQPEALRDQATCELEQIKAGDPVEPAYQRIRHAITDARHQREDELHTLAEEALARAKSARTGNRSTGGQKNPATGAATARGPGQWPVRAFVVTWGELDGWWTHYDPAELATELTEEQAATFLNTADGTAEFAARLRVILDQDTAPDSSDTAERPHLHAL